MFCTKCGKQNQDSAQFCIGCGAALQQPVAEPAPQPVPQPVPQPAPQPVPQPVPQPAPQPVVMAQPVPVAYAPEQPQPKKKATASVVLGIVSILTSLGVVLSLPLSIVGLIIGVKADRTAGGRKAGIALNAVGLALSLISVVLVFVMIVGAWTMPTMGKTTFHGDGYTLTYNSDWEYDAEQELLLYNDGEVTVDTASRYALGEMKHIGEYTTETQMNNAYYALWENLSRAYMTQDITVCYNKNSYAEIQEGLFCFYYEYVPMFDSDGNFIKDYDPAVYGGEHGALILILCPEKNVGYTFTATFEGDMKEGSEIVLPLLSEIQIEDQNAEVAAK